MSRLADLLTEKGFAFVPAAEMQGLLEKSGPFGDWDTFVSSWNDLKTDPYMADKGRYRKRRYAAYAAGADGIKRKAHEAHFQSIDYNPLNGGIERWFEPVTEDAGSGQSLQTILAFCQKLFGALSPGVKNWHIEVHQFRIEAKAGEKGQPTPEGAHRDERDYVLVLLIRRENIKSGVTNIYDLDKKPLGHFTLTEAFDAALVDDNRVYHGVTAVTPLDAAKPAFRDVLVVTFKAT